jgi:hypothetical protein
VLVPPSPKFHDHDVGEPVEVSVNCTTSPACGDDGDHVKFATVAAGAVETVLVMKVALAPPLFETLNPTENDPAAKT